ncbi:outer membrane protein [Arenimonas oryziterrae]|uniref:Outer membrane protein beta-barrel domain-containing protein n=1 Tax=Arenimonas oryziterrae DSM 21050 = YC6267 TaxID=1121015 RepID=A0A091BDU3_9GAMM|nr:outer membrane beta-barrel protein [Arenimonas oryziterrae]KFN42570.1 hypothetical protein N789_13095 [Arenimonas oryziterrae DSM 21050 = YC6267]
MKKPCTLSLLALSLAIAGPAAADDAWDGIYVGLNAGHANGSADTRFDPLPSPTAFVNLRPTTLTPDPSGSVYGAQLGYNWQTKHFLIGFEADIGWANADGAARSTPIVQNNGTPFPGAGYISATADMRSFSTMRLRLGYANDAWAFYATGGFADANIKNTAVTDFRPTGTTTYTGVKDNSQTGTVFGLGAEWKATERFSFKLEAMRYRLGTETLVADAAPALPPFQMRYTWENKGNLIRLGVNYHF